jgi:hypothetical protein
VDNLPLPAGRVIKIELLAELPTAATKEQILEWVKFELGFGTLAYDNPLANHDLTAAREPVLSDTLMRIKEERRQAVNGGTEIRRWLEPDRR